MVSSRIGQWIKSSISPTEGARAVDRDELLAAWPGDSAEPFTVLWFVLLQLAEASGGARWEPHRLASFSSYLAEHLGEVTGLDEPAIGSVMAAVTGQRGAELPDLPVAAMVKLCAGAGAVLAHGMAEERLEDMISNAERVAVAQGIQLF